MKLTAKQRAEIENILNEYISRLNEKEVTPENIALVMMELQEDMDWVTALSVCNRIQAGMETLDHICSDKEALENPDFFINLVRKMTKDISEGQKKGFLLQCLDAFNKRENDEEKIRKRASLSVEELEVCLADCLEEFSEKMLSEIEESLAENTFKQNEKDAGKNVGKEEDADFSEIDYEHYMLLEQWKNRVLITAAAQYMAAMQGILPQEFARYPELLGICSAAQVDILETVTEKEGKKAVILKNILKAVTGAVLMTGAFLLGEASESLFWVMNSGFLETLLLGFTGVGIIVLIISGEVLFLYGLSELIEIFAAWLKGKKVKQKEKEEKEKTENKEYSEHVNCEEENEEHEEHSEDTKHEEENEEQNNEQNEEQEVLA
jgi:Na+-transporting methylmalonyl-CoA/oxaloacetate decarboxylase gamma subunit